MTKIIAFAGRKQSGKTTCSEAVLDYWKIRFPDLDDSKIYNFADALKQDICMELLGFTYEQCYGTDEQKNELVDCYSADNQQMTAREAMQLIGTNFFLKMKENIWVDATINKIKKEKPKLAIIGDCRFPNEVEAVKKQNGTVIKLMRNPFNSDHDSEKGLDPNNYNHKNFDLVIFNNILSIDAQVAAVYRFLIKKGILPL